MKALVHKGSIIQIESNAGMFPVAPELEWVDFASSDGVEVGWLWDGATFQMPPKPSPLRWDKERERMYAEAGLTMQAYFNAQMQVLDGDTTVLEKFKVDRTAVRVRADFPAKA